MTRYIQNRSTADDTRDTNKTPQLSKFLGLTNVLIKTTAATNIQNAGFLGYRWPAAYSCNASGILAYGFEFHGRGNSRLWTSLFWQYILLGKIINT